METRDCDAGIWNKSKTKKLQELSKLSSICEAKGRSSKIQVGTPHQGRVYREDSRCKEVRGRVRQWLVNDKMQPGFEENDEQMHRWGGDGEN